MDVDDDDDDGKMVAAVSTPVTVAEPKAHLCSPTRSTTAGTAFRLPDGRWMDSKNTLQSFDVAAAAARPPHRRVAAASASTVTPSSSPHVVPTSHAHPSEFGNSPSIMDVIRAHAVPVPSVLVVEGELFHPGMYTHHPSAVAFSTSTSHHHTTLTGSP